MRTRRPPEWTDHNVHDPGITLVELLAYAADRLADYSDKVAEEARLTTRRRAFAVAAVAAVGLLWWRRSGRDDD